MKYLNVNGVVVPQPDDPEPIECNQDEEVDLQCKDCEKKTDFVCEECEYPICVDCLAELTNYNYIDYNCCRSCAEKDSNLEKSKPVESNQDEPEDSKFDGGISQKKYLARLDKDKTQEELCNIFKMKICGRCNRRYPEDESCECTQYEDPKDGDVVDADFYPHEYEKSYSRLKKHLNRKSRFPYDIKEIEDGQVMINTGIQDANRMNRLLLDVNFIFSIKVCEEECSFIITCDSLKYNNFLSESKQSETKERIKVSRLYQYLMTYADFNYEIKEFKCGYTVIVTKGDDRYRVKDMLKDGGFKYNYIHNAPDYKIALFDVKDYDKPRKSND